jgi:hypothetical protein
MANEKTRQEMLLQRWQQLKNERSSWMVALAGDHELSSALRIGRYFRQDRNKGKRRANHIYDNTAHSRAEAHSAQG